MVLVGSISAALSCSVERGLIPRTAAVSGRYGVD